MAHCNTIFHSMLKLIPRHHFSKLEAEHGTGRQARSFSRWHQLVHLLSMQLTARASLRDGIASLKARLKSLCHLGVKPVARSTFADANNKRPASFFAALFASMYRRCQPHSNGNNLIKFFLNYALDTAYRRFNFKKKFH